MLFLTINEDKNPHVTLYKVCKTDQEYWNDLQLLEQDMGNALGTAGCKIRNKTYHIRSMLWFWFPTFSNKVSKV
jgi:hypothetical protein